VELYSSWNRSGVRAARRALDHCGASVSDPKTEPVELSHPCRGVCSGWQQGFDAGRKSCHRSPRQAEQMSNPKTEAVEREADAAAQTYQRTSVYYRTPYRAFKEGFVTGHEAGRKSRDAEVKRLEALISDQLNENDELGAEFTYVRILKDEIAVLREFIKEVSLPPYADSDPQSLLETFKARANHLLARKDALCK
jgi:hypothetical protein